MHEAGLNPALIRVLLIALFLILPQILRAMKRSNKSQPPPPDGTRKGSHLGQVLGDAMRQASDQSRARRSEPPADAQSSQFSEPFQPPQFQPSPFQQSQFPQPEFQLPPPTEPESSFIPSFLLLALLACLCLMAYRHWAG